MIAAALLGARAPRPRRAGAGAARRALRAGDRAAHGAAGNARRRAGRSASAITSSAAPARRRPRSPWRGCCRARASGSRFCRAATAARRVTRRRASTRICTARSQSATSRCCWRASRRAWSAPTASPRRARRSPTAPACWCSTTDCRTRRSPRITRFAVIDGEAGFGNGLCFPAGPLARAAAAPGAVRFGRGGDRRRAVAGARAWRWRSRCSAPASKPTRSSPPN